MAPQNIGFKDSFSAEKVEAWLKVLPDDKLRSEHKALLSKYYVSIAGMVSNAVVACFTVPVTVGLAAFVHIAAHAWAMVKYQKYCMQLRCFAAEFKRRNLH
jgi:hypothetical protein